jgi:8-oxo-dGTP diphosphatase
MREEPFRQLINIIPPAKIYNVNKKGKYVYDWPRPMVTVDAVIFAVSGDSIKILLIKRKNDPFKGQWAIPGGFIGIDEELDDAIARELAEETGLVGVKLEQMHTFGKPGRDPRGRQITVVYMGVITEGFDRIKAGDDAQEAQWFDIDSLPCDNMAFDHDAVTKFAIERIKSKLTSR